MAKEHSTLTGASNHEPKGAATALLGQAYISDGAGSGSFQTPQIEGQSSANALQFPVSDGDGTVTWHWVAQGFGYYRDSEASPATQTFNTTPAKVLIDGLGGTTDVANLPPEIRDSGALWDTTNDRITPMANGDTYEVRLDLEITGSTGTPNYLVLQLDIGGGAAPTISILEFPIAVYKAPPFNVSVTFTVFDRATFLTNGGQVFLATDTGTITVAGRGILISRNSSGDL